MKFWIYSSTSQGFICVGVTNEPQGGEVGMWLKGNTFYWQTAEKGVWRKMINEVRAQFVG